jgi:hypothetical protein
MSLCELLKGTYFSNSMDETFSESCLSSVCNHFLSMIVLDHCVPNKIVCASLLLTLLHGIFEGPTPWFSQFSPRPFLFVFNLLLGCLSDLRDRIKECAHLPHYRSAGIQCAFLQKLMCPPLK